MGEVKLPFGFSLYREDREIKKAKVIGHSDISTTMVYVRVSPYKALNKALEVW